MFGEFLAGVESEHHQADVLVLVKDSAERAVFGNLELRFEVGYDSG